MFDSETPVKKEPASAKTVSFIMMCVCTLLYFTSYLTRKNFTAVMVGLMAVGMDKGVAGNIGSALFIAYGAGQVVSGILADKVKPEYLIYGGLGLTIVCNLLFPQISYSSPALLIVIWGLNGFAQAFFWPPILRLIRTRCRVEDYERGCTMVSAGGHTATIVIYLLASLLISLNLADTIFYIASGVGILVFCSLFFLFPYCEKNAPKKETSAADVKTETEKTSVIPELRKIPFGRFFVTTGILFILLALVADGFLRDGIDEWFPTFLNDTFTLGESISTLTGLLFPLFAIACLELVTFIYRRFFKGKEMLLAAILYLTTLGASVLLVFTYRVSGVLACILFLLASGCMHGANVCLTCYVPACFEKYGRMSTVAGLTNASVYIGSSVASSAIPFLATAGWDVAIIGLGAVSVAGALFCYLWMLFFGKKNV